MLGMMMDKQNIKEIHNRFDEYLDQNKSVFLTSSFQTQSLVLLKIISDYDKLISIYFLNTGFHFPETITYKNQITKLLNLNTIDVFSEIPHVNQINANGRLIYTSDTDYCCELNKALPLKKVLEKFDVWVTGLRKDQSVSRKSAEEIEPLDRDKIKYNPLVNWSEKDVNDYIDHYHLPRHPLNLRREFSIGCQPCTRLVSGQTDRENRWFGQTKTECGLHLNFKEKS
tara:strand:- start:913 stop:1593 length:681 start_codon:yes stop_codon:yes gene_type:complete